MRVVARVAALDDVTGQGEGRTREADERHAGVELVAHQPQGVHDVRQVLGRVDGMHALEVSGAADGPLDDWTVVAAEVKADAHGLERQQNVGEHDGGVEVEAAKRLQGDLRRHVRPPAHLDEAQLLPDGAVLRQVPPGLPHEPHRRGVDALLGAGIEKSCVHLHHERLAAETGTPIVTNGSPWAPALSVRAGRRRLTPPACTLRRAPPCGMYDTR